MYKVLFKISNFNKKQITKVMRIGLSERQSSRALRTYATPPSWIALPHTLLAGFRFQVFVSKWPVLRITTKKRQSLCKKLSFSTFCRRFRRFFVVFISFRRLGRFSYVRKDRFSSFLCRLLRRFFLKNEIGVFW